MLTANSTIEIYYSTWHLNGRSSESDMPTLNQKSSQLLDILYRHICIKGTSKYLLQWCCQHNIGLRHAFPSLKAVFCQQKPTCSRTGFHTTAIAVLSVNLLNKVKFYFIIDYYNQLKNCTANSNLHHYLIFYISSINKKKHDFYFLKLHE